ncbi:MAG TPA: histidine kinase [Conexibacter sp.]|nr:histidine kinase [Conexibacter sp.]
MTDLPIVACVAALSWLAGWYVRGSSLQALGLRLDERRLAEAAPERLRASLEAERTRVARDLHDVVAHGVSLIGLLAAGARATLPRDPARARRALDDLDDAVAGTRVELGRLLEALRAGDEPAVGAASLDDLDALASDARRAGQPIALALDRTALSAAPAGVLASACRIVQEALTNARKHADGAPVEVRLSVERGDLLVDVRNAAPATPCASGAGARQGIAGMRERARLLDGELEAAPTGDGGFRVHARLPCDGAPALAAA